MIRKTLVLALGLILLSVPAAFATIILDSSGSTVFQQTTNNPCVIGDPSCKQPTIGPSNNFDYTVFSGAPDMKWNRSILSPAVSSSIGFYDVTSPVPFMANPQFSLTTKNSLFGNNTFLDDSGPYLAATAVGEILATGVDTIPSTFTIGIDVNFTTNKERLVGFVAYKSTDFNPITGQGTWAIDTDNSYNPTGDLNSPLVQLLAQHNGNGFSDALLLGFNLTQSDYYFFEAIYGLQVDSNNARVVGSDGDGMEEFFIIPAGSPPVPEPATMILLGSGLAGAGLYRRLKKTKG